MGRPLAEVKVRLLDVFYNSQVSPLDRTTIKRAYWASLLPAERSSALQRGKAVIRDAEPTDEQCWSRYFTATLTQAVRAKWLTRVKVHKAAGHPDNSFALGEVAPWVRLEPWQVSALGILPSGGTPYTREVARRLRAIDGSASHQRAMKMSFAPILGGLDDADLKAVLVIAARYLSGQMSRQGSGLDRRKGEMLRLRHRLDPLLKLADSDHESAFLLFELVKRAYGLLEEQEADAAVPVSCQREEPPGG